MNQRTLLGRLLSPAGFGLVLIFFLLPFATVSCGTTAERADATFSGIDMAVGGLPKVASPDNNSDSAQQISELVAEEIDLEPLALLAMIAVFAGMVVGIARRRRIRFGGAAAAAVLAVAFIVGAITRVPGHVDQFIRDVSGPEEMPDGVTASTHIRYGFWLVVIMLVGLAGSNGFALLRAQHDDAVAIDEPHEDVDEQTDDETERSDQLTLDDLT